MIPPFAGETSGTEGSNSSRSATESPISENLQRNARNAEPVAMVADAILDCSRRGAIVLDSFGGSGTTLIAAEKTGRRGYLVELDPKYVDVTIARFQKMTGDKAVHAATGLTFEEMQDQRTTQNCESAATTAGEEEEE
jgi:DNA modification methylase